jgi:hypothetical protein
MQIASTASTSEISRLGKLAEYQILDSPPEAEFDEITQIAAKMIGTPISLVSLIDRDRQWFKARYGLSATETPRDQAFCAHAIQNDGLYVVNNATEDPLFADNPLVTGNPNIRFYAGAPLVTSDNFKLGTLCVIDTKPHDGLADDARRILTLLARMVVNLMEARRMTLRANHQARMMTQLAERTVALSQVKDMPTLARQLTDAARSIVIADAACLRLRDTGGGLGSFTAATRAGISPEGPPAVPWDERGDAVLKRAKLTPATVKDIPPPERIVIKGAWMGFVFGLDAAQPLGDFQIWRQFTTSFTELETAMLTDLVRVAGATASRIMRI